MGYLVVEGGTEMKPMKTNMQWRWKIETLEITGCAYKTVNVYQIDWRPFRLQ